MEANACMMLMNCSLYFLIAQLRRSADISQAIIIIISFVLRALLLSLSERDFSGRDVGRGHIACKLSLKKLCSEGHDCDDLQGLKCVIFSSVCAKSSFHLLLFQWP